MVFGQSQETTFLELEHFSPPNFLVKNNAEHIKDISDQTQASTKVATEAILQLKISNTEKLNEKRISKSFMPGDIVFVSSVHSTSAVYTRPSAVYTRPQS